MWKYEKKLQYPVNIRNKNLKMAKYIITQYGGPAGELAAAWQYLDQRYNMPDDRGKAILTDIGTEELLQFSYQSNMRKTIFREKLSFKYLPPFSFL